MADVIRKQYGNQFTDADLEDLRKSTFVKQVEFHREIGSTSDRALQLACQPPLQSPMLVLAETQTSGRGRGSNLWWAGRGALTFSLLVQADAMRLPPRRWPQASMTVGLAVCEAIEDLLDEPAIQLKWPNDVYLRQRKVSGILVEVSNEPKPVIVIGVGINVNNSARHAPRELQSSAIALCDAAEREFPLVEVLARVLFRLEQRLDWIGRRDEELRARWRERCLLTGRTVGINVGTRSVAGLCRGIDDEGALLIETASKTERCFAGVVTRF